MPPKSLIGVIVAVFIVTALALSFSLLFPRTPGESLKADDVQKIELGERIELPEPRYQSETSVEEALAQRRSIRAYSGDHVTLEEVSQLLWAAQGITDPEGTKRTAPSAGALYPLELYVVVGGVEGLDTGVYRYIPRGHELVKVRDGDLRAELATAALGQGHVRAAAIDLVFTAVYERTTVKYNDRGIRYVHMEAGHAAQNVYLQAVSLDLGTVTIGAFSDAEVKQIMHLEEQEDPVYIMPVGRIG
ncbi:MAG: SagB/ThcOx family dehydrogenase [Methanophagales archaeon ANME-1-THS]|nr:MAG: SagB/ThcOx family dehydrogenase [Methanophagales archaeon ANME-1-THS]